MAVSKPVFHEVPTKVNALMQAHLGRVNVGGDMSLDQKRVITTVSRLLHACVDVVTSSSWLNPAIAAMELCQMVTQGMWDSESTLMQLPHMTAETAARCAKAEVTDVFALSDMEEDQRRELLQMSEQQLADVARFCNRYPNIDLSYEVVGGETVTAGEPVTVVVNMERDLPEGVEFGPVIAPRFPGRKEENWWLVVGCPKENICHVIKRVPLKMKSATKLQFTAPERPGSHQLTLFFMCDSYLGCDQEYEVELHVQAGDDAEPMDE
jgi:pre-mRNA-splicing helicase BRR2